MKITLDRGRFAEAVGYAARALPSRPPVPVLAGALIEASDDTVSVSAFDYEASRKARVPATVHTAGSVLVSGRLLSDITRSLPQQPVELVTEGPRLLLSCGSSRFTLPTLPIGEYPALPLMPSSAGIVSGSVLAAAVQQVAVAAGRDDTLPVLTGIKVEIEGGQITLAATDRYRFAVRTLGWNPADSDVSVHALVPAPILLETAKSVDGADVVEIALGTGARDGLIGFEIPDRRTTTRLLDGDFPKFRSLFPKEFASVAHVSTDALADAVKRVSLVAERNTPILCTFSEGQLTLAAGSGDDAQATDQLPADLEGDDISIAFNPHYFLDGLTATGLPFVRLSLVSRTKPALLQGSTGAGADADDAYQYLIMPVRVSG